MAINYLFNKANYIWGRMSKKRVLQLLKGKQAVILRNVTFAAIHERLSEILGESPAAFVLFEAGRGCGKRSIERLASETRASGKALLAEVGKLKEVEGWASISFNKFNVETGAGAIIVKDSFEALGRGPSKQPVCQFLRGYLSSVVSHVVGKEVVLIETKCIAKGDPYCVFTRKPEGS